jgi:uncharacterized protein YbjT (DUF2867 family)
MTERHHRSLVLGGTGHYGREVVAALLRRGARVRVLSRNPGAAGAVLGPDPEVVAGDLERPAEVAAALEGVDSLAIAVSAFAWKTIRQVHRIERDAVIAALDQARRAGVERVVYLSVYEPRSEAVQRLPVGPFGEIARTKRAVEDALAERGSGWTVLGCPPSMEIFFAFRRGPFLVVPGGGPPHGIPTIAARDVGELAAQALLRSDLGGRRFRVTGPEALSFPDAARRISAATGRKLRFVAAPTLPLRAAAAITAPFNPFMQYVLGAVTMLKSFPDDLVSLIPEDHCLLTSTFEFTASTLEEEAHRRLAAGRL